MGVLTKLAFEEFSVLAMELSPENLTCDGELSNSAVKARLNALTKKWMALEKKVGFKVTESDIYKIFETKNTYPFAAEGGVALPAATLVEKLLTKGITMKAKKKIPVAKKAISKQSAAAHKAWQTRKANAKSDSQASA